MQQSALLPVNARDVLPADHLVWDILALVDELDLFAFEAAYRADGQGRPPFHPKVMVALVLYCRAKGIMSGRRVAAACYDDVGARIITGNHYPDRSTVDRFLTTHGQALRGLLPQTLRLGHAEDLVDVSVVAGDGTKVHANAAMSATVEEAELQAQIADLEQKLAAAEEQWQQQVGTDDTVHEPTLLTDDTDTGLPARPVGAARHTVAWRRMGRLAATLHSRKAVLAHLRAHPNTDQVEWAEKLERDHDRVRQCTEHLDQVRAEVAATHERRLAAEANGAKLPGRRPASVDDYARLRNARQRLAKATARADATAANRPTTAKVNTTDPSSRIMPGKRGGFHQLHNVQALADKNQFILHIGTHDSSNDKRALVELLEGGRANLDAAGITDAIDKALFDAGYASEANFTAELPAGTLLVAVENEARQTGRNTDAASSTVPQPWKVMAGAFDDPENRKLYKRRAAIIEPVFAQLFTRFGRTLNYRGDDVITELHLWAVTHNLLKIVRHRWRNVRPG